MAQCVKSSLGTLTQHVLSAPTPPALSAVSLISTFIVDQVTGQIVRTGPLFLDFI